MEVSREDNDELTTYNHDLRFMLFRQEFLLVDTVGRTVAELVRFLLDLADERE